MNGRVKSKGAYQILETGKIVRCLDYGDGTTRIYANDEKLWASLANTRLRYIYGVMEDYDQQKFKGLISIYDISPTY